MPRRLDCVRFRIRDDEIEVAFMVALELAGRAERTSDDDARAVAQKIRGAGASCASPLPQSTEIRDHCGMTLLAFTIKAHTGIRIAELGFVVGAIGGVLLMFSRRIGTTFAGLALAISFVLLIVATHWGKFH